MSFSVGDKMKFSTPHMLLTGIDKLYWRNQLQEFSNRFDEEEYLHIAFGKQDIRGGFSITFNDHKHCVPQQIHFASRQMLFGYVQGYNAARTNKDYRL